MFPSLTLLSITNRPNDFPGPPVYPFTSNMNPFTFVILLSFDPRIGAVRRSCGMGAGLQNNTPSSDPCSGPTSSLERHKESRADIATRSPALEGPPSDALSRFCRVHLPRYQHQHMHPARTVSVYRIRGCRRSSSWLRKFDTCAKSPRRENVGNFCRCVQILRSRENVAAPA